MRVPRSIDKFNTLVESDNSHRVGNDEILCLPHGSPAAELGAANRDIPPELATMTVPTDPRRIDDGPSAIMAPPTSAEASPLSANATIAAPMAIDNESWPGKLRDRTV
jgi:hypothetical protein